MLGISVSRNPTYLTGSRHHTFRCYVVNDHGAPSGMDKGKIMMRVDVTILHTAECDKDRHAKDGALV